jgi:pimeloyl-ACP methyl ester carboxylesterase
MDGLTTADGRRLAYRRAGSGPMLVCHPGGPGFSSLYLGKLSGLGEHLELVLIDPRGTGGSDPPYDRRAFAIDDYVSDLEELRAHLGLERMLLFGHSHGGMVAMAYAARHPERVERLILASTTSSPAPPVLRSSRKGSRTQRQWCCRESAT